MFPLSRTLVLVWRFIVRFIYRIRTHVHALFSTYIHVWINAIYFHKQGKLCKQHAEQILSLLSRLVARACSHLLYWTVVWLWNVLKQPTVYLYKYIYSDFRILHLRFKLFMNIIICIDFILHDVWNQKCFFFVFGSQVQIKENYICNTEKH